MNFKTTNSSYKPNLFIIFVIPFIVWMVCFKGFILGDLALQSDATAYYEHFEFFIRNLAHGEYPMWEATRNEGLPTEFFMRRIGSFNPFFLIILILFKIGISFEFAYYTFLLIYFFIGMVGFYYLALRIFKDGRVAFLAYLLLMFSSLSTRLFDSYFLLTIIPMIWFFYFFVVFIEERLKSAFLGMVFTVMVLFTTYIPFYFIIIFSTMLVFLTIFYFRETISAAKGILEFMRTNKIFGGLGILLVIISLIPGYLFYKESKAGEILLTERNAGKMETVYSASGEALPTTQAESALEVGQETVTSWGIEEDLLYSTHFLNLKSFKFAIVYVPVFAFIIFALSFFLPLSRRLIFLFSWEIALFLIFSPYGPFYNWLFENFSFFSYFRNLHFFLWMGMLPVFVLIVAEQFSIFLRNPPQTKSSKSIQIAILALVHSLVLWFYIWKQAANISTLLSIFLSFVFLMLYVWGQIKFDRRRVYLFFAAVVLLQPVEAYSNLQKNSGAATSFMKYQGKEFYRKLDLNPEFLKERLFNSAQNIELKKEAHEIVLSSPPGLYIGSLWFEILRLNLNDELFSNYCSRHILLYDQVKVLKEDAIDIKELESILKSNKNLVLVNTEDGFSEPEELSPNPSSQVFLVTQNVPEVKIEKVTVNTLKLKTDLDNPKFLVHIDNYHSGWRAFIDGKPIPIYRANIAFKGVWVPAGEHILYFRYGSLGRHVLNYFLLVLFYSLFFVLCVFIKKDKNLLFSSAGGA